MSYGMRWKCWRCARQNHFAGPFEPIELEHLTCERCGAHESIDPTEGAPDNEQVLAGQRQIPGIERYPDPADYTQDANGNWVLRAMLDQARADLADGVMDERGRIVWAY